MLTFTTSGKLDGDLFVHILPQIQDILLLRLFAIPSPMRTTAPFAAMTPPATSSAAVLAAPASSAPASLVRL